MHLGHQPEHKNAWQNAENQAWASQIRGH